MTDATRKIVALGALAMLASAPASWGVIGENAEDGWTLPEHLFSPAMVVAVNGFVAVAAAVASWRCLCGFVRGRSVGRCVLAGAIAGLLSHLLYWVLFEILVALGLAAWHSKDLSGLPNRVAMGTVVSVVVLWWLTILPGAVAGGVWGLIFRYLIPARPDADAVRLGPFPEPRVEPRAEVR